MEHLVVTSKTLVLTFLQPHSKFKFQMDEDIEQMGIMTDEDYIYFRIQEIQQQLPNSLLQSYCVTDLHKLPKEAKVPRT